MKMIQCPLQMPSHAPKRTFMFPQTKISEGRTIISEQPSATSPLFFDNLPHWGENFDKHFKVDLWLTLLSKCSKWRLSKKRGLVADGCFRMRLPGEGRHFSTICSPNTHSPQSYKCFPSLGKRILKGFSTLQNLPTPLLEGRTNKL